MDTDSNWGPFFALRWQSTNKTHHSLCHYWKLEEPSKCRHFLLWWYFLHLSKPVLPDIQHTHSHRRRHDTSYLCLPPWKESSHLHQILHSHQRLDCWLGLSIFTNQCYGRLRDSSSQLQQRGFSWHQHQWLFFPLHPEYMEKSTGKRTLIPYRDNDDVRTLVRRAGILLLIPLASVEDVWFHALEDRDNADITQLAQPFTDYVTDQWVEGDRSFWNHYGTEGPRTTNNIEGWHSKLKKISTLQCNSSKTSRTVLKLQRSREQLVVPFDHEPRNTLTLIANSQHSRTYTRLVWSTWLLMQTQLPSYST